VYNSIKFRRLKVY